MIQVQNLPSLAQPDGKPYTLKESADAPERALTLAEWLALMLAQLPHGNLKLLDGQRIVKVQTACYHAEVWGIIEMDDDVYERIMKLLFDDEVGKELTRGTSIPFEGAFALNLFSGYVGVALYNVMASCVK